MFSIVILLFLFKQKTAYEMRISDWSSDVCSSDLAPAGQPFGARLKHAVLPMIAGGVVGGLPALYYLVQDPDGFLAHTLRYFTYAHHDYWQTLDEPKVMDMAGQLQIAEQMWLGGAKVLAALLAPYNKKSIVEGKSVSVRGEHGGRRNIK